MELELELGAVAVLSSAFVFRINAVPGVTAAGLLFVFLGIRLHISIEQIQHNISVCLNTCVCVCSCVCVCVCICADSDDFVIINLRQSTENRS